MAINQNNDERQPYGVIFLIILILVVSGVIAMIPISGGPAEPWQEGATSPDGYMTSMALFVVPLLVLLIWLEANKRKFAEFRKAFWITVAIMLPLATALDVFLGNTFFIWPNPETYIGVYFPGYTFGQGWGINIPIEELAFYLTGIVFMLLSYIWASTSWVPLYSKDDHEYVECAANEKRLVLFHPLPLVLGIAAFLVVLLYKKFGDHPYNEGFPGYFAFLIFLVCVPSAMFYRAVGRFINLRAFLVTTLLVMMISLLWEGTLGLAYGWWNYRPEQMMGIFIAPWYNLPVEELVTWSASAWMNVTILEVAKIYCHSDRKAVHLLSGYGAAQ